MMSTGLERQASLRNDGAAVDAADAALQDIEADLTDRVALLLNCLPDDVARDAAFSDHGLDSVVVVKLTESLNKHYSLKLTPVVFFQYPTVRSLAEHLTDSCNGRLAAQDSSLSHQPAAAAQGTSPFADRPAAIAIIGVAGKFPDAADLDALWANLLNGRDSISEIPPERWDWREVHGDPTADGNFTLSRWGGFIEGVDQFDAAFFNIPPREAQAMDPQQRLLMTYVWKAIEEAGYAPSSLSGSNTGVFFGTGISDYNQLVARSQLDIQGFTSIGLLPSAGPNRISHLLNLHGPSEPVETACSSSLVAIHRAVCAIRSGECDLAIAGGVNTLLSPENHISLSKAGALSADGRCRTFSDNANGYVRSEGVAAVVLKPLAAAERDGDHIHGVIRGSSVNHGGRSNSFTAPNPAAQAQLIIKAHLQSGIDPNAVSYIETHGTGTILGDPIEVAGLKTAFAQLDSLNGAPRESSRIGLGSIKSNIGHLELAAGIAGVVKVLLQLKHKTLVRSLHCEQINPFLTLDDSHFYVVQANEPWACRVDADRRELPRCAGVSSFSVTGTNAHLVIEEYVGPVERREAQSQDALVPVVLSARTNEQLRAQATQLLAAIKAEHVLASDLADIAYTLQLGRDSLSERLVILAASLAQLEERLCTYLQGDETADGILRGHVRITVGRATAAPTMISGNSASLDPQSTLGAAVQMAAMWVNGAAVDWACLHTEARRRRLSLPSYPFARDRHWIPTASLMNRKRSGGLLGQLRAEVTKQGSKIALQGSEFFLADHVVRGERVLPAVAYLEMAIGAACNAGIGAQDPIKASFPTVRISNVVWMQRFAWTSASSELGIELTARDQQSFAFEIYSIAEQSQSRRLVHAQGLVACTKLHAPANIDLAALRRRCPTAGATADECYQAFSALGLDYGPAHRTIQSLHIGEGELLARLVLAESAGLSPGAFVLHPGILDGATQAIVGFAFAESVGVDKLQLALPFELEDAQVYAPSTETMWAHLRRSPDAERGAGNAAFDITLYDEQGKCCAVLKGFATRAIAQSGPLAEPDPTRKMGSGDQFLQLGWQALPDSVAGSDPLGLPPQDGVVIIGGSLADQAATRQRYPAATVLACAPGASVEDFRRELSQLPATNHLVWFVPDEPLAEPIDEALLLAQESGVLHGFRLIRALLAEGHDNRPIWWTVVTRQAIAVLPTELANPTHAGVHGLLGSAAKELALWNFAVLDLPRGPLPSELFAVPPDSSGQLIGWREGQWVRQHLIPQPDVEVAPAATKPGGVYIVIGGAGGLGQVWTQAVLRQHSAQIVWAGRSPLSDLITSQLDYLETLGPRPRYLMLDATDLEQLTAARDDVRAEFGRIDGVVHSAMVLEDRTLANMKEATFRAGFAAKVDTSVHLAQVFSNEPLDFLLFFSAFNAFEKSAGQCNYVAGCTFMDALALHLAGSWQCRVRVMNWGFWGDVGVGASEFYRARMAKAGMASIDPSSAMRALDRLMAGTETQAAFVRLNRPSAIDGLHIRQLSNSMPDVPDDHTSSTAGASTWSTMRAMPSIDGEPQQIATPILLVELRHRAADILGVEPDSLESPIAPFSERLLGEFGMDSLSATMLRNQLRHQLGVDLRVQSLIGETAGRISELMFEQLLLRQISNAEPVQDGQATESFVF